MSELKSVNPLFANISPVIEHKVFNNTKLSTPGGGSQFWEKGVIEPDIILKDLIKIIHPDLIKSHELKYYFNLQ
jgi:iron complex transport system substrate-binding protein